MCDTFLHKSGNNFDSDNDNDHDYDMDDTNANDNNDCHDFMLFNTIYLTATLDTVTNYYTLCISTCIYMYYIRSVTQCYMSM